MIDDGQLGLHTIRVISPMISDTASSSYTLCLLIDQVNHTTLLFPVVAKSQAMQVVQASRIAWRSAFEATSMDQRSLHMW